MATGQILLQRFYYAKSLVKHDVEVSVLRNQILLYIIMEEVRPIYRWPEVASTIS